VPTLQRQQQLLPPSRLSPNVAESYQSPRRTQNSTDEEILANRMIRKRGAVFFRSYIEYLPQSAPASAAMTMRRITTQIFLSD
jgi:hypothetical protein